MLSNFDDSFMDNYENFYFGEKSHFSFPGELNNDINDLNSQNQNEFFKEEKPFYDNDFGFHYMKEIPSSFLDFQNIITGNTEPTSLDKQNELLNQKRQREEIETKKETKEIILVEEKRKEITEEKEEENEHYELGLEEEEKEQEKQIDNTKKKGRRKKEEKYENEASHNKFKEDNIMRKIKTFTFKYIYNKLNDSLIDTDLKFYSLDANLSENLKKDFNEELLERTICDIYSNSNLNKKYKNENHNYSNKETIKTIMKDKFEKKTISILNLKYRDILDIIRKKDIKKFLDEIRKKEIKNQNQYLEDYMKAVQDMLMNYENWFFKKQGRNKK